MSKGSNPAFAMWEKRASANDNLPDVVRLSGFGKKTGVTNVRRSETKEALEEKRPSTNDKLPPDELPDIDIDIDIAKLSVDTKAEATSPKLRKAETLEKAMGFSPKAAKTPQQSPKKRVVNASLADRMKAFNGPLNQTSENNSSKAYLAENAKKMRGEQSKKRHEMRKKNVGKVAPIKQSNVTAARVNLDEFVPPVYEKSDTDCNQIAEALQNNFVFENLNKSDEKILIKAFEKMQVHEGQQIIKQGDQGDYFYVIGEGKVRFEVKGKVVGTAEAGKSFGELSLLYTSPRSASVIAESNPTVLFRVDQNAFRYVMETKAKEKDGEKMSLLKGINFLKDFNPSDLHRLCDCMTPRHFEKDEVVVTKGADGEAFYILKKGMMVVKDISVGGTAYEDVTLAPGDYFGERALLTSEPRAANVVGMEDGVCFLIDRFTFEKVLGNFSQVIMRSQDKVKLVRYCY
jgi:cAMP-dependent protein kinase regulator